MKHLLILFTVFLTVFNLPSFGKSEPADQVQEIDNSIIIDRISNDDVQINLPKFIFSFSDAVINVKFLNPEHTKLLLNKNKIEFIVNGEPVILNFINGEASFKHRFDKTNHISIYAEDMSFNKNVTVYPMWALLIPLILIVLYLLRIVIRKK